MRHERKGAQAPFLFLWCASQGALPWRSGSTIQPATEELTHGKAVAGDGMAAASTGDRAGLTTQPRGVILNRRWPLPKVVRSKLRRITRIGYLKGQSPVLARKKSRLDRHSRTDIQPICSFCVRRPSTLCRRLRSGTKHRVVPTAMRPNKAAVGSVASIIDTFWQANPFTGMFFCGRRTSSWPAPVRHARRGRL